MIGGVARRATFFKIADMSKPREIQLRLAGPNEFLHPTNHKKNPADRFAPAFVKAYTAMDYDRVYITEAEQAWLEANGAEIPASFKTVGQKPVVETLKKGGLDIGLVFFPQPKQGQDEIPPDTRKQITATAKMLRPTVQLLVGLSNWGKQSDQVFLNTQEPVLDVLLGSGKGPGITGQVAADGNVLWARAFTKGKYLNVLDLYDLPAENADKKWPSATQYVFSYTTLDSGIVEHPEIKAFFHGNK